MKNWLLFIIINFITVCKTSSFYHFPIHIVLCCILFRLKIYISNLFVFFTQMSLTSGSQSNVGVNMPAQVWKVVRPNKGESLKNWLQEVRGYHRGQTPVQPGHHRHLPLLQHTHSSKLNPAMGHIIVMNFAFKKTMSEGFFQDCAHGRIDKNLI